MSILVLVVLSGDMLRELVVITLYHDPLFFFSYFSLASARILRLHHLLLLVLLVQLIMTCPLLIAITSLETSCSTCTCTHEHRLLAVLTLGEECLLFGRARSGHPKGTLSHLRLITLLQPVDGSTARQLFSGIFVRAHHIFQLGIHLTILPLYHFSMLLQFKNVFSLIFLLQIVLLHQVSSLLELSLQGRILGFEFSFPLNHLGNFITYFSVFMVHLRIRILLARYRLLFNCDAILQRRNFLGQFLADRPCLFHL